MNKVAVTTYLLIITLNVNGLYAPVKKRMDKEVVHRYNEILLDHKKEWNLTTCANMDGPRGNYAKWNKSCCERQYPMTSLICII